MKTYIKIGVVVIGVVGIAFGYYTISPFFIQTELFEEAPELVERTSTNEEIDMETEVVISTPTAEESESRPEIKKAAIVGTAGHEASGTVSILDTVEGQVVRYENFHTVNGPDIFVYLSKDLEATEFVDLGKVKATNGNINYSVPDGVDAKDYKYAMVWCKAFGVLFNYAEIN